MKRVPKKPVTRGPASVVVGKSPVDPSGTFWVYVRLADEPSVRVGFRYSQDGAWTGVVVEPFEQTTESGAMPLRRMTARFVHGLPVGRLEEQARRFAVSVERDRLWQTGSGNEYAILDEDGNRIGSGRLVTEFGAGSPANNAASHRLEGLTGPPAKRVGRPPKPDAELARVAARYCELREQGRRDHNRLLADEFGVNPSTVSGWIESARERGVLSPTFRGKAGGYLTERGLELLEGESK